MKKLMLSILCFFSSIIPGSYNFLVKNKNNMIKAGAFISYMLVRRYIKRNYSFDSKYKPNFICLNDDKKNVVGVLQDYKHDDNKSVFGSSNYYQNVSALHQKDSNNSIKMMCALRSLSDLGNNYRHYTEMRDTLFTLSKSNSIKSFIELIFFPPLPFLGRQENFVIDLRKLSANDKSLIECDALFDTFFKSGINNLYIVCSEEQYAALFSRNDYKKWADVVSVINPVVASIE